MARIPVYTRQASLNTDRVGRPRPRADTAGAEALAALGGAVADVGSNLQRRQDKLSRVKAAAGLQEYSQRSSGLLEQMQEDINPAGQGFVTSVQKKLDEHRNELLSGLTGDVAEEYAARGNALTNQILSRAASIERDQGYRFSASNIDRALSGLSADLAQNPDRFDDILELGNRAIDEVGALLPDNMRQIRSLQWERDASNIITTAEEEPSGLDDETDLATELPRPAGMEGIDAPKIADVERSTQMLFKGLKAQANAAVRTAGVAGTGASLDDAIRLGVISKGELAEKARLLRAWHDHLSSEQRNGLMDSMKIGSVVRRMMRLMQI